MPRVLSLCQVQWACHLLVFYQSSQNLLETRPPRPDLCAKKEYIYKDYPKDIDCGFNQPHKKPIKMVLLYCFDQYHVFQSERQLDDIAVPC